ncbi:MAG: nucleotidyltransferase domain-containing protein [Candidatus Woesearchaeota archaeon]
MKQEIQILKYLIGHNSQKFTIREISKNLGIDYKNTHTSIQKLEHSQNIIKQKIGNTYQIEFNNQLNSKTFEAELERREELFQNKNFKLIYNKIKDLCNPFIIVLIFGSFAKKTRTKLSDIDLCVICNEEETIKKLKDKLSLLPLDIDLNDFSVEEFKSMLIANKSNVGKEIIKHNIILYGIENYYNIIENE